MSDLQMYDPTEVATIVSASIPALLSEMGSSCDDRLVVAVNEAVEPIRLSAGETLFSSGDTSDAAYFVVTGRLLVVVEDSDGNEVVIRKVGRGKIVGEIGLVEQSSRTATIRADRDCTLARLPRAAFDRLSTEHPGFLMGVTRTVVQRLLHPRPSVHGIGTVAVAVANPELDARILTSRLLQTMESTGASAHVSSAAAAAAIGGEADGLRVEQYLDAVEAEHRFLLLETDSGVTPWSASALRRADRVLIVVSPNPAGAEDTAARAFAEAARSGYRPDIWLAVVRTPDAGLVEGSAALAERYGADRVLHFRTGSATDMARLARLATGTGTGLVLGGGGARGFAHIGVYRALTELGVPIDAVAGSSIGGIIGAGIATAPTPDALTKMAVDGFSKVLDYTIPLVSMVKGALITKEINKVFKGVDFEDLCLPFLCVSTNLTTSRQVVHDKGPVTVATRAGLAIPGVIPPVPSNGDLLVDGGVLDNLPVEPLRASGLVETVIAVDVAPRVGPRAREDFGLSVSGWQAVRSKLGRHKRKYPGISAVLLRTMVVGSMQRRDDQIAAGLADLFLDPDLRGISLLAFGDVESVAKAGYEAAYPIIEEWLAKQEESA